MDMYQKSEIKKNKKMNEDTKSIASNSINRYKPNYGKLPTKAYK